MARTVESWGIVGGDKVYLNLEKFKWENYADKVHKLFSETVHGYIDLPVPRPTQTHAYDFGCTFMGVWLLDGEFKSTTTNADIGLHGVTFYGLIYNTRCGTVYVDDFKLVHILQINEKNGH